MVATFPPPKSCSPRAWGLPVRVAKCFATLLLVAARARVGFARPQHPRKFSRKCSSRARGVCLKPEVETLPPREYGAARARGVCLASSSLTLRGLLSGAARARVGFAYRLGKCFPKRSCCSSRSRGVCPFSVVATFPPPSCSSRAWGLPSRCAKLRTCHRAARGVANAQLNPFVAPGPPGAL